MDFDISTSTVAGLLNLGYAALLYLRRLILLVISALSFFFVCFLLIEAEIISYSRSQFS